MSGRLVILPKKSYCPWNPQNVERVLRDERLNRERLENQNQRHYRNNSQKNDITDDNAQENGHVNLFPEAKEADLRRISTSTSDNSNHGTSNAGILPIPLGGDESTLRKVGRVPFYMRSSSSPSNNIHDSNTTSTALYGLHTNSSFAVMPDLITAKIMEEQFQIRETSRKRSMDPMRRFYINSHEVDEGNVENGKKNENSQTGGTLPSQGGSQTLDSIANSTMVHVSEQKRHSKRKRDRHSKKSKYSNRKSRRKSRSNERYPNNSNCDSNPTTFSSSPSSSSTSLSPRSHKNRHDDRDTHRKESRKRSSSHDKAKKNSRRQMLPLRDETTYLTQPPREDYQSALDRSYNVDAHPSTRDDMDDLDNLRKNRHVREAIEKHREGQVIASSSLSASSRTLFPRGQELLTSYTAVIGDDRARRYHNQYNPALSRK